MTSGNVLITGGLGCIGSETAKWLIRNSDVGVVVSSRRVTPDRIERVFHDVDRARLTGVEVDVRDQSRLEQLLGEHEITHVAHMAALQTPDCNAHRDLGLQINLAGTQNMIEAMKASGSALRRYVFASSIAVYGPRADYAVDRVPTDAVPNPVNVYGTWKLAGEQLSRFFWEETGVATVSLRPGVLFGPGRDAGLTSTPTTAMKALALGLPYEIPFRSRQDYLYAPDVGAAVGRSLIDPFDGHGIFTLPSHTVDTSQIVAGIHTVAKKLGLGGQFKIRVGDGEVPFICDLQYDSFLEAFPKASLTRLDLAIRQSLEVFVDQVKRGWLTAEDLS